MAKPKQRLPELIVLASNVQAIHERFQGWPDLLVSDGRYAETLHLPVHEELPLPAWREQLHLLTSPSLEEMRVSVQRLQQAWSESKLGDWSGVAHSLLLHYLLWTVGGKMLLQSLRDSVGAAVVRQIDESAAIWPGFLRSNQEFGVSLLLGCDYVSMTTLRDLLDSNDVTRVLATLRSDLTLQVNTPTGSRVLNRISALSSNRAADGAHQMIWPQLAASKLQQLRPELQNAACALSLLLRQAVLPITEVAAVEAPTHRSADLGLIVFSLLVKLLADDWLSAKLLPQPVQALLSGLS